MGLTSSITQVSCNSNTSVSFLNNKYQASLSSSSSAEGGAGKGASYNVQCIMTYFFSPLKVTAVADM
jgi:hypothetical protein